MNDSSPRSQKRKNYFRNHPWMKSLKCLNTRCKRQGIVHYLTGEKIKFIWNRDGAEKFKKAILVRKFLEGNFTTENCKFVECDGIHR